MGIRCLFAGYLGSGHFRAWFSVILFKSDKWAGGFDYAGPANLECCFHCDQKPRQRRCAYEVFQALFCRLWNGYCLRVDINISLNHYRPSEDVLMKQQAQLVSCFRISVTMVIHGLSSASGIPLIWIHDKLWSSLIFAVAANIAHSSTAVSFTFDMKEKY
jgi:hypothetical protein